MKNQQINPSNNKPMFLLGAGASVDAGLPVTNDVTEEIFKTFQKNHQYSQFFRVTSTVIGALQFQQGINIARGGERYILSPESTFGGIDVERFYNAIELLAQRNRLSIAPLIERWHPTIDWLDTNTYRDDPTIQIAEAVQEIAECVVNPETPLDEIGGHMHVAHHFLQESLKNFGEQLTPGSAQGQLFDKTCDAILTVLKDILWIQDKDKALYMTPLAKFAHNNNNNLVIATLNYDNVVELAFNMENVPLQFGIDEWSNHGTISLPADSNLLLKLHGSLDWVEEESDQHSSSSDLPHQTIKRITSLQGNTSKPAVIFGEGNKLRPNGPFLDLLAAFKTALGNHQKLVIIGYSFRDHHINALLSRWFNADPNRQITVVDPGFKDNINPFASQLRKSSSPRLTIIDKGARDALEQVTDL